jgi:hypothetical protein
MDLTLLKPWIPLITGLVGALVVTALVLARIWSRESAIVTTVVDNELDTGILSPYPPPADGPRLEMYGIPVRLAALVLAPVGRGNAIDVKRLPEVVEQLLPGLQDAMGYHQPVFRRWVEQVSVHGFQNAFLKQVKLPGNRGKGTVWSAFVGKFTDGEQTLLAGVVLRAEAPNSYGATVIEHEGHWLECLRVRRKESA